MVQFIVVLVYLCLPALILFLCNKYQFLNCIGSVVLAYAFGLLLGLSGLLGEQYDVAKEVLMSATVPLAIPLLLFSSNVREWKKLAIQPFYSLVFAMLAVFIAVISGYLIFHGQSIEDFNKVGGLLVGIYSGGTPNLASLKMILNVDEEIYLAVHSYDMAIGAIYLFVLMGFGQRLFSYVLPQSKSDRNDSMQEEGEENLGVVLCAKQDRIRLLKILGLVVLMVAASGGVMLLLPVSAQMVVFIFLITAMGISGSSIKTINQTKGTFSLGMYLILIFSVVVASKVQLGNLTDINPVIFAYITFVVFISLLLHVLLASVRKIDADTVIITSAALICSPPFVPVVAGSLRNRSVIVPGLTIGLIGYALGNYLGYLMAILLGYF
ncbi:DUF819 family protein [Carboxylicivirga sediminis]|uniref:DUF819 family protein n=1 Tax=Carboxylicivirga sediminis TaxID=2006564 RepID=A0A941IZ22_9BACT|nr:DUF819 family protein [Carboxylicivirga sediminis]MBR8537585.1 DUF819 family protein [Carboxylicivirga sediminis]